tara:strand:- start:262 stop:1290 length:1029 start_codon:yes stop_codon:yes gene_type:complete
MTDVIIRQNGSVGHITLNRPDALNALTYNMILKIEKALISWKQNEKIKVVLVDANGDKAFCSGGDVSDLYNNGTNGNFEFGKLFWSDEYRLNLLVSNYPKPYVVFMQGFTMGGGVGISCHGSHRIVGDSSIIAMPECSIGLVPDVGGSYLLTRKSKKLGIYLGISGQHMKADDAIFTDFADFNISEKYWNEIKLQLIKTGDTSILFEFQRKNLKSCLKENLQIIEKVFSQTKLNLIIQEMELDPFFSYSLKKIKNSSPLSVLTSFHMLQMPEISFSLKEALKIEYRVTSRAQEFADFQEGIRAMIIDKDKSPLWKYPNINQVPMKKVFDLLEPLSFSNELKI